MNENSERLEEIQPKSTLSVVNEIMNRQIGQSPRLDKKLYNSLEMVGRLEYSHSLHIDRGRTRTIEFNRTGDLLVSGWQDRSIVVWNWAAGKKLNSYTSGHRSYVYQAEWLPCDDLSMITCAADGEVRFLDLMDGTTRELAKHRGPCWQFATHPDTHHTVTSIGDDGKVLSIDVRDNKATELVTVWIGSWPTILLTIHSNPRNGNEFCVGGEFEPVKIYDRRRASEPIFELCPKNLVKNKIVTVDSVTYNHNGTDILASYDGEDVYLFHTMLSPSYDDYAHKYQRVRSTYDVNCTVNYFGPMSEFIVSGSSNGYIFFWEKNTEAIVQCLLAHAGGKITRQKAHPYIPVLATSGYTNDIKIWVPSANQPVSVSELEQRLLFEDEPDGLHGVPDEYDSDDNEEFNDHYEIYDDDL